MRCRCNGSFKSARKRDWLKAGRGQAWDLMALMRYPGWQAFGRMVSGARAVMAADGFHFSLDITT